MVILKFLSFLDFIFQWLIDMFGLFKCNASILARQQTDANLFFVRILFKAWLWPIITSFGKRELFSFHPIT